MSQSATTTSEPTEHPSRRAANKARTRQRIVDAALDLFSENGYDDTTVDEIARHAGVSPRTFFRYFETKERVLFFGREEFFDLLVTAYLQQPQAGTDLELITRTIVDLAPRLEQISDRIARYFRAIASSIALRGRDRDERVAAATTLSNAVARRHGRQEPSADDDLLGTIVVLLLEHALTQWLASGATRPLAPFYLAERERLTAITRADSPQSVQDVDRPRDHQNGDEQRHERLHEHRELRPS
jgi:AcrR family transcriptional regulator